MGQHKGSDSLRQIGNHFVASCTMPNAESHLNLCQLWSLRAQGEWTRGKKGFHVFFRFFCLFFFVFSHTELSHSNEGQKVTWQKLPKAEMPCSFTLSPNPNLVIMWRTYTAIFAACSFTPKISAQVQNHFWVLVDSIPKVLLLRQKTQETEKITSSALQLYCPAPG